MSIFSRLFGTPHKRGELKLVDVARLEARMEGARLAEVRRASRGNRGLRLMRWWVATP